MGFPKRRACCKQQDSAPERIVRVIALGSLIRINIGEPYLSGSNSMGHDTSVVNHFLLEYVDVKQIMQTFHRPHDTFCTLRGTLPAASMLHVKRRTRLPPTCSHAQEP